jgi:hypothetical protein
VTLAQNARVSIYSSYEDTDNARRPRGTPKSMNIKERRFGSWNDLGMDIIASGTEEPQPFHSLKALRPLNINKL